MSRKVRAFLAAIQGPALYYSGGFNVRDGTVVSGASECGVFVTPVPDWWHIQGVPCVPPCDN